MPVSNVNPDRPVDLSRLTQQAAVPAGGVVASVTTATFERDVVQRSMTGPVIVDVWSPRSPISAQLSALLDTLAGEYQGRLAFVRVAADSNPDIVQALQMEAIPSVFAFLGGRLVPLFTGGLPEAELRPLLDQVVAAAAQTGNQAGASAPEPPADPRFDGVTQALEAGDWDAAIAGYQAILKETPADAVAKVGLLSAQLYKRTDGQDLEATMALNGMDTETQLQVADAEFMMNMTDEAFARLVALVAATSAKERAAVQERLIGFFDIVGPKDPAVARARTALANALF